VCPQLRESPLSAIALNPVIAAILAYDQFGVSGDSCFQYFCRPDFSIMLLYFAPKQTLSFCLFRPSTVQFEMPEPVAMYFIKDTQTIFYGALLLFRTRLSQQQEKVSINAKNRE